MRLNQINQEIREKRKELSQVEEGNIKQRVIIHRELKQLRDEREFCRAVKDNHARAILKMGVK